MTELTYGEPLQIGDKVISSGMVLTIVEIDDEFAHARRKNVTLLLPKVYSEEFKVPDEFGITNLVFRN